MLFAHQLATPAQQSEKQPRTEEIQTQILHKHAYRDSYFATKPCFASFHKHLDAGQRSQASVRAASFLSYIDISTYRTVITVVTCHSVCLSTCRALIHSVEARARAQVTDVREHFHSCLQLMLSSPPAPQHTILSVINFLNI